MENVKHYNDSEIEQYLNNQMSRGELNAFEETLLIDPLLAGALDGFMAANKEKRKRDLQDIQDNIQSGSLLKNTTINPKVMRFSMLRIAAVFLGIAAAGVVTYSILYKVGKEIPAAKNRLNVPSLRHDTIKTTQNPLPQKEDVAKLQKDTFATEKNVEIIPKKEKESDGVINVSMNVKYAVVRQAFFHSKPSTSDRLKTFINPSSKVLLIPTKDENGFVYFSITKADGKQYGGWLRKGDLKRVEEE